VGSGEAVSGDVGDGDGATPSDASDVVTVGTPNESVVAALGEFVSAGATGMESVAAAVGELDAVVCDAVRSDRAQPTETTRTQRTSERADRCSVFRFLRLEASKW
jgi:hypothetical protein